MMPPFLPLLAPLALLVPLPAGTTVSEAPRSDSELVPAPLPAQPTAASRHAATGWIALEAMKTPVQQQVRIEHRVMIRVAPATALPRTSFNDDGLRPDQQVRLVERPMGRCLPVSTITAVRPVAGNRLLLRLRDRRLVTAALSRGCRAADFYSGFYVERREDGMLCADRDELQSRTGATCEVGSLRQLVASPGE